MKSHRGNCLIKMKYSDMFDLYYKLIIKSGWSILTLLVKPLWPNIFYDFQTAFIDCEFTQSSVLLQIREYSSCRDF